MTDYTTEYAGPVPVAGLSSEARSQFLRRTYLHLGGAILAFTAIEVALFTSGMAERMALAMLGTSWLLILGAFMVAGWLFSGMAARATTVGAQYAALAGYVVAEAIIFVPILFIADRNFPGVIASAAVVTLLAFSGLTALVMATRQDFSFLGGVLRWGGIVAIVTIVAAAIFGFTLGTFFSVVMVAFAGAAILYNTSDVLHRYPEDRYISAALSLFAAVALMFWYILRLFMSRD